MTAKFIHAGVIQFDVRLGDNQANLDAVLSGICELAGRGAQMAVLPELWASGFDNKYLASHAEETPRLLDAVQTAAAAENMVIAGSLVEKVAEQCQAGAAGVYNTLYVIDADGSIVGQYRKAHLFSAAAEDEFFLPGNQAVACESSLGKLGVMICYDLRFPELGRMLALNETELLIVCAQWPASRIGHWETLLRARAIENQLFVVAANRCGKDPELVFGGKSQIISPFGEVLATAGDDPVVLTARLEMGQSQKFRDAIPCFNDRRTDIYKL